MHDKVIGANLPSVGALSYIGDARHSLYVRLMLTRRGVAKSGELNELSLKYVTAEAQAQMSPLNELFDERDTFNLIEKTIPEMDFEGKFTTEQEEL